MIAHHRFRDRQRRRAHRYWLHVNGSTRERPHGGIGAIQIIDLLHARQHLWDLARKLHPNDERKQKRWMQFHQPLLEESKIKKLNVALRSIPADNPE